MRRRTLTTGAVALCLLAVAPPAPAQTRPTAFFEEHCYGCHDATARKGGLDLAALAVDPSDPDNFARWLKVHDRIESGEMPPRGEARPPDEEVTAAGAFSWWCAPQ